MTFRRTCQSETAQLIRAYMTKNFAGDRTYIFSHVNIYRNISDDADSALAHLKNDMGEGNDPQGMRWGEVGADDKQTDTTTDDVWVVAPMKKPSD